MGPHVSEQSVMRSPPRSVSTITAGEIVRGDRAAEFHSMMQAAGLSEEQAAELCCVSRFTVRAWMRPNTSMSHNRCPEWATELLRLKIDERNRNARPMGRWS